MSAEARAAPAPSTSLEATNRGLRFLSSVVAVMAKDTLNPRLSGLLDELVATTFVGHDGDHEGDHEGDEGYFDEGDYEGDEGDDEGDYEGDYEGDFEGDDEGDEGEGEGDALSRPKPDLGRTSRALHSIAARPKECPFGHRARQNTSGGDRWCWSCDRLLLRGEVLLRCFHEECADDRDYCLQCCQADSGSE